MMQVWLGQLFACWVRFFQWLRQRLQSRVRYRRRGRYSPGPVPRQVFAQPKPIWVRNEVIRLKALMPQAGCRSIAHHFNRRWAARRQMTVSKTYVADTCRRHQYRIYEARRKLKHRVPRPMPRNRIWGCDLLTKTDQRGRSHIALALVDHGSRACLRLQPLANKSSLTLVRELTEAVRHYGRPQFLRTDNEAVFTSVWFTWGLRLLGIHHQRTEPGCPWQNGRVERFIGTVKRELARASITNGKEFDTVLRNVRAWYNHDRPHDHLQGRTPAEVWAGIDVFAPHSRSGRDQPIEGILQPSG